MHTVFTEEIVHESNASLCIFINKPLPLRYHGKCPCRLGTCPISGPIRSRQRLFVGARGALQRGAATVRPPRIGSVASAGADSGDMPGNGGGLHTQRPPAEIQGGLGGISVWIGQTSVFDVQGRDVTPAFVQSAQQALELAQARGIHVAVLKEGSPSCGSAFAYDGSFTGGKLAYPGVTAACLQQAGIRVLSEHQWDEAQQYLDSLGQ